MYDGITAHSIIKNEENWIWYSLMSVLDQVDEIIVYDTGSTDNTIEIIESINSPKIKLKKVDSITSKNFSNYKNQMLGETKTNWFFALDGDEIWNKEMFKIVIDRLKEASENKVGGLVHYLEFVKDIMHYYRGHEQKIYPYNIKRSYGWMTTRFIKQQKTLESRNNYGMEGWWVNDHELQASGYDNLIWNYDVYYFHARNLLRSSTEEKDKEVMLRVQKRHHNKIGEIPKKYGDVIINYPEVFWYDHPKIVPDIKNLDKVWFNQ